ncbi:dienelactone hydrolase family protein [Cellulosimicrobium cellulans]|uniref:phosphoribosyltransferase family protein n=1 Tax=Cellulosimicrobium cellulans TaxID=1710 RepID=UPI001EDAEDE1|nr:phosphoribosyltransferase family protein [Cellulosimicrobium cellulans]UKJ64139.1 dienelactone hydrolase family protein [Cellulosimicrobium cellulans]
MRQGTRDRGGGGRGSAAPPFADRSDAGRRLARRLAVRRGDDVVVLGLPRGGVPVAFEVAQALGAPLDVVVVRKLGLPFQPELAMGAVAESGVEVLDREIVRRAGVDAEQLRSVEARERAAVDERAQRLRRGRPRVELDRRVAVVVDDGLATGATARAACEVARRRGASRVVLAVPVVPADVAADPASVAPADELVYVVAPRPFVAVGRHYVDFSPTTDDEVAATLDLAARLERARAAATGPDVDADVEVPVGGTTLEGRLHLPEHGEGVVVFAHGSGSSRHSPRNRYVASVLYHAGLGTLLLDLLTPDEETDRHQVFDVELLAGRLASAVRWLRSRSDVRDARVGLFGASTGAAAALLAAADPDLGIAAVVSRGGRPDLAGGALAEVRVPTLLVVGGADTVVLRLNRRAVDLLAGPARLVVVPGATHLFDEPGALGEVALLARDWFARHLLGPAAGTEPHPGERP